MFQNFRTLLIPKALRFSIACMFLSGRLAVWFERVNKLCLNVYIVGISLDPV